LSKSIELLLEWQIQDEVHFQKFLLGKLFMTYLNA
jgi:hypothetical protein